jgi:hypothetical protein
MDLHIARNWDEKLAVHGCEKVACRAAPNKRFKTKSLAQEELRNITHSLNQPTKRA